jgi:hypothetical protein
MPNCESFTNFLYNILFLACIFFFFEQELAIFLLSDILGGERAQMLKTCSSLILLEWIQWPEVSGMLPS